MLPILLLLIVPHDDTLTVHCDVQEYNEVWDCCNDPPKCHLRQLIIRDVSEVRDWRANRKPVRDWVRGGYTTRWIEQGRVIEVRSSVMIETLTEYDRELAEREWLPECQRRRVNR